MTMNVVERGGRASADGVADAVNAVEFRRDEAGTLVVILEGSWRIRDRLRPLAEVAAKFADEPAITRVACDASRVADWDSSLVAYLTNLRELCERRGLTFDASAVPPGVRRLTELALAVPPTTDTRRAAGRTPFVTAVGQGTLDAMKEMAAAITFLGEIVLALARFLRGRASYRGSDLLRAVQDCGAQALPIVSVISLLVGLTMAFMGAIQLKQFGADIYTANLIGIAMTREMAALMTAIVLAGRTGAAYAAQLGTMQGNEDALATLAISPIDFLVLPRVLALGLMMPLLFRYSCFVGIFGGYLVGVGMLGLPSAAFLDQLRGGVTLADFAVGFVKSIVFGGLVAIAGTLRGIQAGRSAAAVGHAATSAVVTGMVYIIVVDALFAVATEVLGI